MVSSSGICGYSEATRELAVLPPFIIDQIRKREEDERHRRDAPAPVVPLPEPLRREQRPPEEPERGVVIIDLNAPE